MSMRFRVQWRSLLICQVVFVRYYLSGSIISGVACVTYESREQGQASRVRVQAIHCRVSEQGQRVGSASRVSEYDHGVGAGNKGRREGSSEQGQAISTYLMLSTKQSSTQGAMSSRFSHKGNQSDFFSHQICTVDGLSRLASNCVPPSPGTIGVKSIG